MIILALSVPFHYFLCSILFESYELESTIISTNLTYILILAAIIFYIFKIDNIPKIQDKNLILLHITE